MFPNPTPPEDDGPPPTPVDVPGWTAARNAYLVSIGRHTGDAIPNTPPPPAAEEDDDELPPSEPVVEPPPLPNPVTGRGNPDALDPKEAAKARRREYAKAYYRRNRDRILQKAKARYRSNTPEGERRREQARVLSLARYREGCNATKAVKAFVAKLEDNGMTAWMVARCLSPLSSSARGDQELLRETFSEYASVEANIDPLVADLFYQALKFAVGQALVEYDALARRQKKEEEAEAEFRRMATIIGGSPNAFPDPKRFDTQKHESKKRKNREYMRQYREKKKAGFVRKPGEWVKPS